MGKIIFCSDLVLRVDNHEEIQNVTEWLMTSTDYRPAYPEGCVVRNELSTMGKLCVIMVVWSALIILTTFYCYFCEQRLFPKNKLIDSNKSPGPELGRVSGSIKGDELFSTTISSNLSMSSPVNSSSSRSSLLSTPTQDPKASHYCVQLFSLQLVNRKIENAPNGIFIW